MKMRAPDYDKLMLACFEVLRLHEVHPSVVKSTHEAWQVFRRAASYDESLYGLYDYLNDNHVETALKRIFTCPTGPYPARSGERFRKDP